MYCRMRPWFRGDEPALVHGGRLAARRCGNVFVAVHHGDGQDRGGRRACLIVAVARASEEMNRGVGAGQGRAASPRVSDVGGPGRRSVPWRNRRGSMHAGTLHAKTKVKKGDFNISVDGVTLRAVVFDGVRAEELVDDTYLNKRTYGYGCC